jgi:Ni/Co efflux regulator RcnB
MKLTHLLLAAAAVVAAPAAAQTQADDSRMRAAQQRFDREYQTFRQELDRYQSTRGGRGVYRNAPDQGYQGGYDERDEGDYDPARYYRSGTQYQERTLSNEDRVYAGQDGRYYCRRNDGTTGLIVGAGAGGILGNVIDGGRSRIVGTLLGGAAGALAGRAVQQGSSVRCR